MKNTISIEQPSIGTWQRAKWQYVSLVAGLAVAATAAGFGVRSDTPAPVSAHASTRTVQALHRDAGEAVFYLAGNLNQADWAASIEAEAALLRMATNSPEPARAVHVLSAGTPQESLDAKRFIEDTMAAENFTSTEAPHFVVVDLR